MCCFGLYAIIKLDNFLFHLVVLCFVPLLFLVYDFLSLVRYYTWFWFYQRFLYIFSNGKYGHGLFFNRWLNRWYKIRGLNEALFVYGNLLKRSIFRKARVFLKKLPARLEKLFVETLHIYKYALPLLVIKLLLYFFFYLLYLVYRAF